MNETELEKVICPRCNGDTLQLKCRVGAVCGHKLKGEDDGRTD